MKDVDRLRSAAHAESDGSSANVVQVLRDQLTRFNVRASVAITLLVSVVLLPFAVPVADDYCRAALDRNWLDFVAEMYRTWTGRWAAMGFYALVLPRVNLTSVFYTGAISLVYLACAFAWYGVARMLFAEQLGKLSTALLGVALVAFYWAGMPAPGEAIYWLSGSIEYTLPFALCVFTVWLLVGVPSWARAAAAAALAVLVTGLQEVAAIALTSVLGAAVASAFFLRSPARPKWTAVFVCVVIGTAINVLAPGNGMRLEEDFGAGNAHDVVQTLEVTLQQVTVYLVPWLLDAKLLAASVLLVMSPWFRAAMPSWAAARPGYWRVATPVVALAAIGGIFLALGWAVGGLGPARLYGFTYGVFLIGWFATLFVWSRDLAPAGDTHVGARVRCVASCVLVLAAVTSVNVGHGFNDFVGDQNLLRFRGEMRQRFATIEAAKSQGNSEVVLDVAPRVAESFFQRDIGADAQHWRNVCVASYFGLETIRVASPQP